MYLEKALFDNVAPFKKLELNFNRNEIAVLSSVNGRGKTTILSNIADAFYEIAKNNFPNEFSDKENKFYRISSSIFNTDFNNPSFVYLRFKTEKENIDFVNIRNSCTEEQYNNSVNFDNKIPFDQLRQSLDLQQCAKLISHKAKNAREIFSKNILTYFPSYRFEQPGYLNDPYKLNLNFTKDSGYTGYLKNPIEVISGLPQLANWFMDVILDNQYLNIKPEDITNTLKPLVSLQEKLSLDTILNLIQISIQINVNQKSEIQKNLNSILTQTLISKNYGNLRFGIGLRGYGSTRIQVVTADTGQLIYPSIFNISSGESAILCLFGELLRHADNLKNNSSLSEAAGIVLVDEIDKHLHIKLQKEVLPELFKLFPNIQFIVSSHSPFLSMGLAEKLQERSKLIDIENGLSIQPSHDRQYQEVYEMMINENNKYKKMFDSIKSQIKNDKELQIITEGNNTEHIRKAISVLDSSLITKVEIIEGAESKTGGQQLKNAFDIMSNASHSSKFLFVWDFDFVTKINSVTENSSFFKFCFDKNEENVKIKKGIENLYFATLFTDDLYDIEEKETDYGKSTKKYNFNKNRFLEKIKQENDPEVFKKFKPLIEKIKSIIYPLTYDK